jgi:hypothetical protein
MAGAEGEKNGRALDILTIREDVGAGIGAAIDSEKEAVGGLIDAGGGEIDVELAVVVRGDPEGGVGGAGDGNWGTVHSGGDEGGKKQDGRDGQGGEAHEVFL